MNPIGFSTGFFFHTQRDLPLLQKLELLKATGQAAIEIHLTDLMGHGMTDQELALISQFAYRSIHLPTQLAYPSPDAQRYLKEFTSLANEVQPHAAVLHPDFIEEPSWVIERIGDLLAIENMDWRKRTGNSVESLSAIFTRMPAARWVYDVNHVYTIDPSMALGQALYAAFSSRLAHCHLSGFGGSALVHSCLCETHETAIIEAVPLGDAPIILESVARQPSSTPETELRFVTEHLHAHANR